MECEVATVMIELCVRIDARSVDAHKFGELVSDGMNDKKEFVIRTSVAKAVLVNGKIVWERSW
jgi:hypothetical protein